MADVTKELAATVTMVAATAKSVELTGVGEWVEVTNTDDTNFVSVSGPSKAPATATSEGDNTRRVPPNSTRAFRAQLPGSNVVSLITAGTQKVEVALL